MLIMLMAARSYRLAFFADSAGSGGFCFSAKVDLYILNTQSRNRGLSLAGESYVVLSKVWQQS
jgi:hypothetical protein